MRTQLPSIPCTLLLGNTFLRSHKIIRKQLILAMASKLMKTP